MPATVCDAERVQTRHNGSDHARFSLSGFAQRVRDIAGFLNNLLNLTACRMTDGSSVQKRGDRAFGNSGFVGNIGDRILHAKLPELFAALRRPDDPLQPRCPAGHDSYKHESLPFVFRLFLTIP